MFDKLFARKKPQADDVSPEAELRQAIAALLVEAACADDHYDDREKVIIESALAATFDLSASEAGALRSAGEAAQSDALDIQRFTRVAKQMSPEKKINFIESLWEIVLSDSVRDPFEDALIRRICGLIYLDDKESGAARSRVAARLEKE